MPLDPIAYSPYTDPDDFIREVTDRIWVGRDIAHIYDNYEPDSIVHGGFGTTMDRAGVIDGSLMRIAETPQHIGVAEDVIWEARGDDAFLSSHLVFAADEHIIDGRVQRVRSRTVANCLYRRGRMVEEWVVRDSLAAALQRRLDPAQVAQASTFLGYSGSFLTPAPTDVLAVGDSGPRPDDYRAECQLVLQFFDEVWTQHQFNLAYDVLDRDVFLHSVGDITHLRPDGWQRETLRLVAAFPTARFEVRDIQTNYAERYAGLRIAVLWKMVGRYDGRPHYGPLTNEVVNLLGVSQFLIQRGRIVRETRIYDEVALRSQINSQRGDVAYASTNIY